MIMYLYNKLFSFELKSRFQEVIFKGYMLVDELNCIKYLTGYFENDRHVGIFKYENDKWDIENKKVSFYLKKVINELKEMGYEI